MKSFSKPGHYIWSFCFQSFPWNSKLCVLETGSIQQRVGCFLNVLDSHKRICSPIPSSVSLISRFSHKVLIHQATLIMITLLSQTQPCYPQLRGGLELKPFDFTQNTRFITEPKQVTSFFNNRRNPGTSGMDGFRKKVSSRGISKESSTLNTNVRQSDTITQYKSS